MKYWLSTEDGGWVNLRQAQRIMIYPTMWGADEEPKEFGIYVYGGDGGRVLLHSGFDSREKAASTAAFLMKRMWTTVEGATLPDDPEEAG